MKTIDTHEWKSTQPKNVLLLDVRSPGEFTAIHAEEAINLPLDRVSREEAERLAGDKEIILLCQGGTRAKMAGEKLSELGDRVSVFEGGTQAWKSGGLPVVESKGGVISLERQVRIGAGALVLIGLVLSQFMGLQNAVYLSMFVGAGLVFAGVTDTCAMGLILAKMPWNSRQGSCCGE